MKWGADRVTDNPDAFWHLVKHSRSCAIFVDEAGKWKKNYLHILEEIATTGRHYGHNVHFIAQRAQMIPPTVRNQCENLFLFKQALDDARALAADFVADELLDAKTLKKGEFFAKIGVDGEVSRGKIVWNLDGYPAVILTG